MSTAIHHPCPYSAEVLPVMAEELAGLSPALVIDPFAGPTGADTLADATGLDVIGIEIEPEWAACSERNIRADARRVSGPMIAAARRRLLGDEMTIHESYDGDWVVGTSPAYGGRMADQYLGTPAERQAREATGKMPRRRSYAISLGRRLSAGSGAALQWGPAYRSLHEDCIARWWDWSVTGAVINISDHYRNGRIQPVSQWWQDAMVERGFTLRRSRVVTTSRFRDGANSDLRAPVEFVLTFVR